MASKMYDHPSSKSDKPKAEDKPAAKTSDPAPAPAPAADPAAPAAAAPAPAPAAPVEPSLTEKQAKARADLFKLHETERRDMHGLHKDAHRQMEERQAKAREQMNTAHELELAGPGGGAPAAEEPAPAIDPNAGA